MPKIIVFQSTENGMELVRRATKGLATSIMMMDRLDTILIHSLIDPSVPTLFIAGTVHGQSLPVIQFAQELRARHNGNVVCLGFSLIKLPTPPFYDCIVKDWKDGKVQALRAAIEKFLKFPVSM